MVVVVTPKLLKGLSKSRVIDVLESLSRGSKTLTEIQFDIRAQLSTTQRALETLKELGLITSKRKKIGKRKLTVYEITSEGIRVLEWLKQFEL